MSALARVHVQACMCTHAPLFGRRLLTQHSHLTHRSCTTGVYFGTLLGMADHIAFTLGAAGYRAYKMVPYGPVDATMAYLLRRALENADVLGGCAKEVRMMQSELYRRMRPSTLWGSSGWAREGSMQAA